jgi:hypothetical protein
MGWIGGEFLKQAKKFKNGALKDRIKDTMAISKVFKILM